MKIAVVGSGPSAMAALHAIDSHALDAEVAVFDIGLKLQPLNELPPKSNPADKLFLRRLYSDLRRAYGYKFPPPKTLYGAMPELNLVSGKRRIWKSQQYGGLSNIWGASVLPFTNRELTAWPLKSEDFKPYYNLVADKIGISGASDGLNAYFGADFVNRPPIPLDDIAQALSETVDTCQLMDGTKFYAGCGRLALETRPNNNASCIQCGACMTGCSRGSIYSAFRSSDIISRIEYVRGRVMTVDFVHRRLEILSAGNIHVTGPFDRIYLAAGCFGTSEILMRSTGIISGPEILDNSVYTFPIVFTGKIPEKNSEIATVALTNLVIGCLDDNEDGSFVQIQIYPSFAHLWRYFLPGGIWPAADYFGRFLRRRVYWARMYLPNREAARYAISLDPKTGMSLELSADNPPVSKALPIIEKLRQAVSGSGFRIPRIPPASHATSSHYAGSFPIGGKYLDVGLDGAVGAGVYICDSSSFITSPSISPTFTIMANAWRTADLSLKNG